MALLFLFFFISTKTKKISSINIKLIINLVLRAKI